ncbi:Protein SHQ1 [Dirofilaria immitis]
MTSIFGNLMLIKSIGSDDKLESKMSRRFTSHIFEDVLPIEIQCKLSAGMILGYGLIDSNAVLRMLKLNPYFNAQYTYFFAFLHLKQQARHPAEELSLGKNEIQIS